jgi:hypothetical protein
MSTNTSKPKNYPFVEPGIAKSLEDIACELDIPSEYYKDIVKAMKQYGKQVRDSALEWASENAEIEMVKILYTGARAGDPKTAWHPQYVIDKQSILKGKKSKKLKI